MLIKALRLTFDKKQNWLIFVGAAVLIFGLLIFVPVWTTPGNDFLFQLRLLRWYGILLVAFLAVANGFLLTMQVEIRKKTKLARSLKQKTAQTTTAFGLLVGALASTVACAACYSSLFALFGLGATAFLVDYRFLIAGITILITLSAIYYSARRLNNECAVCRVSISK